jgi:hypothetical protein
LSTPSGLFNVVGVQGNGCRKKSKMVKTRIYQKAWSGSLLALFLIGLTISTIAQVSGTASVSATIVTPMAISKAIDLDFGNVAVNANAGTVELTPAGTRLKTGGVSLPGNAGTVTSAAFNITGAPGFIYSITLPLQPLTITNGGDAMTVNMFASDPAVTGILDANGEQTLKVGATLLVGASQPVGDYTSNNEFAVTVNYN